MRSLLPSAALLAGAVLVISGCQSPISPESEGPLLHTAPAPGFSAELNVLDLDDPGCISQEDGTLVFDDCSAPETIQGGLVGPGFAVFDQVFDLTTGNGELKGRATFGTDSDPACLENGDCGIFEGAFEGDIIGFQFFGEFKLVGISGDVKGVKMEGTDIETGPGTLVFILDGTIRFPT